MKIFEIFKRKTLLEKLIDKADKLWRETGRQYFIMPVDSKRKKMMLIHGRTFLDNYNRTAKKKGIKTMDFIDMTNICLYKTPIRTTNKR